VVLERASYLNDGNDSVWELPIDYNKANRTLSAQVLSNQAAIDKLKDENCKLEAELKETQQSLKEIQNTHTTLIKTT